MQKNHRPVDAGLIKDILEDTGAIEICCDEVNAEVLSKIHGLAVLVSYLEAIYFDLETGVTRQSTWTDDMAAALAEYTAIRAGYLDELDFALEEAIAAIPTVMVGTDDAALASVLGDLDDAQSTGPTTGAETAISLLRQTVEYMRSTHEHISILFVIPEAVDSINADNTAIYAELRKLCPHVHTITQTDALDFPNFTSYSLCVLGTNKTAWDTANLADIKTVPQLPILCFDKVAAAYLEIGTDGGDAVGKTAIDVSARIEGSVIGIGGAEATGLAAGSNTISSSSTYHTLNMANANITEVVYATETEDVDGGTANTDVVIGFIPGMLEDGAIGIDEEGSEVPATLAFFGAGYEAAKLTTLGLAVLHNIAHVIIHAQKKPLEIAGTIQNLRRILIGNMGGQFSNTSPLVEWLVGQNTAGNKLPIGTSLYDVINAVQTTADAITAAGPTNTQMETARDAIITEVDANETLLDAITPAGPSLTQMNTAHALLATEAKQDVIDGNVDEIEVLVDSKVMGRAQMATRAIDLQQAAGSYQLFTATTQDVVVESLVVRSAQDLSGDSGFTGISIETETQATSQEFISSAAGAKANLTVEAQVSWTGAVLMKSTIPAYIMVTIYGGAAGSDSPIEVVATYRAVVSGGYLDPTPL